MRFLRPSKEAPHKLKGKIKIIDVSNGITYFRLFPSKNVNIFYILVKVNSL
jgi:hypothetical protein